MFEHTLVALVLPAAILQKYAPLGERRQIAPVVASLEAHRGLLAGGLVEEHVLKVCLDGVCASSRKGNESEALFLDASPIPRMIRRMLLQTAWDRLRRLG